MIIIEASHIGNGGGYVLLTELLRNLSIRSLSNVVYTSKKEVYFSLVSEQFDYSSIVLTSTWRTLLRYSKRREGVLYFSNLPPFVKNSRSIVYFQNELILNQNYSSVQVNIKYYLYYLWIKYLSVNVDTVACQTNYVYHGLRKIGIKNVSILPFFESYYPVIKTKKIFTFCYICSGGSHKNVGRLLEAFKKLVGEYDVTLAITIENSKENSELIRQVEEINRYANKNVITNVGYVTKGRVFELYQASGALVFPSLKETLGLPLIEANMFGVLVLSADLPYSYEVLSPPIVFNPYDTEDIRRKMEVFIKGGYSGITQTIKVVNEMDKLINMLLK